MVKLTDPSQVLSLIIKLFPELALVMSETIFREGLLKIQGIEHLLCLISLLKKFLLYSLNVSSDKSCSMLCLSQNGVLLSFIALKASF